MKIRIILSNSGGELDRQTIEVNENAKSDETDGIYDAISAWKDTLAAGDTIKIVEVSSLPEGVTVIGLDNPAELHNTIKKAVGP